jgi:hypothetical protein
VLLHFRDVTAETRWSRDLTPLLRNPSVYGCRLETGNVFTPALRNNVRGATRHATAELGTARRKNRFVNCSVIFVFTEALPIYSLSKSVTILIIMLLRVVVIIILIILVIIIKIIIIIIITPVLPLKFQIFS